MENTNLEFRIYKEDGTPFEDLVLRKSTISCVVMSLGDNISGDVYYKDNTLNVSMKEYIEYNGVKYILVNPPTIVREGMVSDNGDAKGLTKYSFVFYHPMYMLGNFPFSDVAVSIDEKRYISENRTFYWIGKIADFAAKLNKNLENTEWVVELSPKITQEKLDELSEVLTFENNTIADALKTAYDTWEEPFVIDSIKDGEPHYNEGKRFLILFGLPSNEIYATQEDEDNNIPFVFRFGQGLGLKNNSATPKNNKIVTRIAGYGSEDNIPFGYPQIVWEGDQTWDNTNNDPTQASGYPIVSGIVGGEEVRLIKHPFTRTHLMPSIFVERVNKKVNPFADGYDPDIEIIDYYDADDANVYENVINPIAPSFVSQEFENIKPEFDVNREKAIEDVFPDKQVTIKPSYLSSSEFIAAMREYRDEAATTAERNMYDGIISAMIDLQSQFGHVKKASWQGDGSGTDYEYTWSLRLDGYLTYFELNDVVGEYKKTIFMTDDIPFEWNDNMDDNGEYEQSYFNITLPILNFDLYACAAITQEMKINMRSGACTGCTFTIQCDWDDYKKNFYDVDGNFAPRGSNSRRDFAKYPDSRVERLTVVVQKDIETFGTVMPNIYQQPKSGDLFVILGISLPQEYVTEAEQRLDAEMKDYMLKNNVYYFEYPLKCDEYFLAKNSNIVSQIRPNSILRFDFAGSEHALYVQEISIKYGDGVLPKYDITLTDGIDVTLNQIGQTVERVSVITENLVTLENIVEEVKEDVKRNNVDLKGYQDLSEYLSRALSQDTDVLGGLILTTLIALKDEYNNIWSGINGAYDPTKESGGIAAWFGGRMVDHEEVPNVANFAQSLFRFNGSGYLAGGNISWDTQGNATFAGTINANAGTFKGFIQKKPFFITADNFSEIGINPMGGQWNIPFEDVGSCLVFENNWWKGSGISTPQGVTIVLPSYNPSTSADNTLYEALAYVGNALIIVCNDTTAGILLSGLFSRSTLGTNTSTSLNVMTTGGHRCAIMLECRYGNGGVFWYHSGTSDLP